MGRASGGDRPCRRGRNSREIARATQPGQDVEIPFQETRNTVSQEIILENGTPRNCKRLLGGTAPTDPPNRGPELEMV